MARMLYCLLLLALLTGCQPAKVKRQLAHQWRYDLPATRSVMDARGAELAEKSYMESIMSGLQYAVLDFRENGALGFSFENFRQEGRWRLRKRGKVLIFQIGGKEQVYTINTPFADTLLLDPVEPEGLPFPRVLIKVNQKD